MSDERIGKEVIYEIKIQGHLEKRWAAWFENLAFSYEEDDTTILRGLLNDQAALHGVLNHIRNLNLQLISVQPIEDKGEIKMKQSQGTINMILKAVAIGTSVAVLVLSILNATTVETNTTLLAIGLFALALHALHGKK